MIKGNTKYLLDFIPAIILIGYTVRLIGLLISGTVRIEWMNFTGFAVLPLVIFLLIKQHQLGVLALGLVLLLAIFGAVSFTDGISTWGGGLGKKGSAFSFELYGKPVFIIYFILHVILSGRFYTGILTRKYWVALKSENPETGKDTL